MNRNASKAMTDFVEGKPIVEETGCREMYDRLSVAIYATNAEGFVTYFNPAAARLAGRTPVIGADRCRVTWKTFLPDGSPLANEECPKTETPAGDERRSGVPYIAERPDGTRFWFADYPVVLREADGRVAGHIHVLIDTTESRSAEIDANARFNAVVEATPECVQVVAPDGTLLFVNSRGARMMEAASAEDVTGGSVYSVIAPEHRDRFREMNERVCRGQRAGLEFDIVGLQGTRRHMETHAVPLCQTGEATLQLALTRDITMRTEAERSGLLLAAIVDSSDDAIISKSLDSIITSWNKSAERLFGYTSAEVVGKSITILIPQDRLQEEPQIIARLRRGERVDHFETKRRRKDGTLLDISLTISPVKDKAGNIIGASKIARDITERKMAEIRQQRVEDELRRVNADLEQFAYSASHDLQEPVRSVNIYSELLELDYGDLLGGEALEYLKHLRTGASRMETLVRDLLSYTQVTKYDSAAEPSPAQDAFAATIANLAGLISETRAQVTSDPLPVLPVHRAHLQQLFQNLIGNAIKYRSPGRVPIVHVNAARSGEQWLFSVSDNGIGIEPEYKENIFGLFKRLHTSDEYPGTGLGLAICQRIVGRYGGRIWVESEPGQGSTFRFTLPV